MIVDNYQQFGGAHPETAALKNVLAQAGVVAPHTKQPFTEAMLFGLGGGLGAGWSVVTENRQPWFTPGFRYRGQNADAAFLQMICKRIGVIATVKEASGTKSAEANLKDALDRRRPAIAWGSLAALPYYGLPEDQHKMFAHVFVVYGWGERSQRVCLDDRAVTPWHITPSQLAVARSAIPTLKQRVMTIAPSKKSVDLRAAVEAALRDCADELLNPKTKTTGLVTLEKWEEFLTDSKDVKGWPQLFKPGLNLYRALLAIYHHIETAGTGGSAFRAMYADFLEQAAKLMPKAAQPMMTDIAAQYRKAAKLWSALAIAALPDNVDLLAEAREVTAAKYLLLTARGAAANSQLEKINRRLAVIESETARDFPLKAKQVRTLLDQVRTCLKRVRDAEEKAASGLQKLIT